MVLEWTLHTLVALAFVVALLGTVLPILPGAVLAAAAVLLHRLVLGPGDSVSWSFVAVAAVLAALAQVVDYLATWWGAKRFGASWQGALGGILGGILGALFFGIPGFFFGPLVGAVLFELIQRRTLPEALRSGVGTLVGGLVALVAKLICTAAIILGFYLNLA